MSEITYRKVGDYYLPNIELDHTEDRPLRKYGRMRRTYLQEHCPILFTQLILKEQLFPHLWEIDDRAEEMMEQLMTELPKKNPPPDKMTHQLEWVQHMNMLKAQAEEIVLNELVYDRSIPDVLKEWD